MLYMITKLDIVKVCVRVRVRVRVLIVCCADARTMVDVDVDAGAGANVDDDVSERCLDPLVIFTHVAFIVSCHALFPCYVAGLNYIAAFLLTQMREEDAYWTMYTWMHAERFNMRRFYLPGQHTTSSVTAMYVIMCVCDVSPVACVM